MSKQECIQTVNIFGHPLPRAFWKCQPSMHENHEMHLKDCAVSERDKRHCEAHNLLENGAEQ